MKSKTIAFIPVRGGSKSIPLKNIKLLCGKPLVCWSIEALEDCKLVDSIIIATDSDEIERTVLSYNYKKVEIYHRSAESATDTATTESVMLEYIKYSNISDNSIIMLVQATSPLTMTTHFTEALELFHRNKYDSILSCVKSYRFFWNPNGTSKNYDYRNRPRRQNFKGELMENGALYINTVKNVFHYGNRLSGNIGIYIMPEYTATEIDEPDDWILIEKLMKKYRYVNSFTSFKKKIKLLISDVDGVLTDGGMYYSENGDELKKFNTRDGMGFQLLREVGIKTAIITSENTRLVTRRAEKLKIDYVYQGKMWNGKLEAAKDICEKEGITMDEVAYIGDDLNCLDIMKNVGFSFCPIDAEQKIKDIASYILTNKGGHGAFRECVNLLLNKNEE